ncbi:MAG TPA: potassium transporter TrkG, partial [Candidatus Limnocylindria bacterium]|nr:potassium transporter TrkG [Candidatus Limnocylindria bacterium]
MGRRLADCSTYGKFMAVIGLLVAAPLIVIPFDPASAAYAGAFALPAAGSVALGVLMCLSRRKDDDGSTAWYAMMQRSSMTVLFAWTWGIIAGSVPFMLGTPLSPVQSLFESVSGWTTTGLSVINVAETPRIFLFHRSFMQFCGGLGFVLMMVMLVSGKQSMNLYNAEGHPDKLMPNLRKTAQTIFLMYSGFLAVGTAGLFLAGMGLFDAVLHAMCALSTGGFSTRLNSIGEFRSAAVEAVTIALMLVGTTNFAVLLLLVKGKWRQAAHISEVRFMFLLLAVTIPLTALTLAGASGPGGGAWLRGAVFDVVSALSTTGYSTTPSYAAWPPAAVGILIFLMLVGGGFGSTAGGIKLARVYVMLRLTLMNVRKRFYPSRKVQSLHYVKPQGKSPIDASVASDTTGFVMFYLGLFVLGSLAVTLTTGSGLTEGMFEFAS